MRVRKFPSKFNDFQRKKEIVMKMKKIKIPS